MRIGLVKNMEIKILVPKDAPAIREIMEKSFSNPWPFATMESLISSDSAVALGAFEGDVLTGYAFLEWVLDEGSLTDIAVHPQFRGRGISLLIMESLLQEAKYRNLSFVTLEVRVSNIPAISLYRRFGFEEVGRRPAYYTNPTEDALLMTRNSD